MEPEAKYTLVGAVVIALLAALVLAVIWLRSTSGQRDDVPYKIYFFRQSLEGLQIRSDVKMQGIKIGTVTAFRISARQRGAVEVIVRVDGTAPVLQETRATVERHLLTGIASIRLVNAREDSPPLKAVQPDEPYPLIAEGEPANRISESIAEVAERADETMRRINLVLSDENQAALKEILVNVRRISGRMESSLAGLDRTVVAMGGAADEVRTMSAGITTETRNLASRYDKLGEESIVAARDISATVQRIGSDVASLSSRMDGVFADAGMELRVTAQELRATADSLGTAARRFSDPGRILFGASRDSLGPGETRR